MFRVKTSRADLRCNFYKTPRFLVDDRPRKTRRSCVWESLSVKKWKCEKVGLLIVLTVMAFSACRSTANVNSNTASVRAMRVVRDDLDREVIVPVRVTRAISLAPNLTESIFAVGAGDRLVGVTTFCDYPEAAKTIAPRSYLCRRPRRSRLL
jgi:hypothetical protein